MYKKIFVFLSFILLSNCSTPATAFLGPIITGAKTGSVYQASLSYGSNRIINSVKELDKKMATKVNIMNDLNISTFDRNPKIISANKTKEVELLEIFDEEPLP